MPPVSGQSASCSRSYARFTEEWSVCLARGSCREEEAASIDAAFCTSIDGDPRSYIHISTRAMKRRFLGSSRKEPAGLCTICKSKRKVSIDTLQAASIDSIHHQSIDTIHPTSIDKRQAAVIDRANKSTNNTVHRGTIHRGTVHHNTIHHSTLHRDTIHRDTIYLPSIDTVHPVLVDTIHIPSIDTVHPVSVDTIHIPSIDTVHPVLVDTIHNPSIDTVHPVPVDTIHLPSIDTVHILLLDTIHLPSIDTIHLPSIDTVHQNTVHPSTVHPNTVHRDIVHPNTVHTNIVHRDTVHRNNIHRDTVPAMTNTTYGETEKVEALILKIDKKGIWRDEEGRPCSLTEQLINSEGSVIPDVIAMAEMNTFNLTSQWYDWGSEDLFYGLLHEDPKDLIKRLKDLASANKHDETSADHIICKIFPYCLSRDAFSWFSKLQPRSLTCWEDIKEAFIGKFSARL
ncbi:unnamed protein product [Brassica rapa]|uniref:Retrotransposon gag domain-containing protein n=1 Tax=Brassica campestris TaxID=3711 RepID=A0A8D9CU80_BRACM|nr:unnamed protein product [Brassica rapa]